MRRAALPLLALALSACAVSIGDRTDARDSDFSSSDRQAIVALLEEQAAAWNRGDLDAFMDGYWDSHELVFTSGGRVQRGWDITLDRYRATYGSAPETMGRLSFTDLEIHPLHAGSAWVLGRWALDRSIGQVGGVFTLVLEEMNGGWKIVHDHTSTGE